MVQSSPRVALHVGYHETASTWLQQVAFPAHPGLRCERQLGADGSPRSSPVLAGLITARDEAFDPRAVRAALLDAHADAGADEVVLVSHDRLAGHPLSGGRDALRIARRAHACFPEARVFWFVRDPAGSLDAVAAGLIRAGWPGRTAELLRDRPAWRRPSAGPAYWRYDLLAGEYVRLFGAEQVRIISYEQLISDHRAALDSVAAHLGVDPWDPDALVAGPTPSARPPARGIRARRVVNRFASSELNLRPLLDLPAWARPPIERALARVLPDAPLVTRRDAARLEAATAGSVEALDALGIGPTRVGAPTVDRRSIGAAWRGRPPAGDGSLRVAVHLGYRKTGSTWFQTEVLGRAHPQVVPVHAALDGVRGDAARRGLSAWVTEHDAAFDPERTRADLVDAAGGHPGERVLLVSAERLSGHPASGGADALAIAERVGATFPEAQVFWFLRDRASSIRSEYGQLVDEGWTGRPSDLLADRDPWRLPGPDARHWEYEHLVAAYRNLLGRDRVAVLDHAQLLRSPTAALDALAGFLGVEPWAIPPAALGRRSNVRTRAREVRARRLANHLHASELAPHPSVEVGQARAERLVRLLAPLRSDADLFGPDLDGWVGDRYRDSDRALAQLGVQASWLAEVAP